jgi:C1A family cysteine protease
METSYGFRRDVDPDKRHYSFELLKGSLPKFSGKSSDLRKYSSPRHDQRSTSSCVAQSIIKALEIKRIQKNALLKMGEGFSEADAIKYGLDQHRDLSRLAVYYMARELMEPSEIGKDAGTYIHLAADVLRRFGVCCESPDPQKSLDKSFWPFDINAINKSPGWLQMRNAYLHKISAWYKIYSSSDDRVNDVIHALEAGNPVVYGTEVGPDWSGYDGRALGFPTKISGGHATVLVGWDNENGHFWGENSWGDKWGPYNGFYKLLPEVVSNEMSNDFIVITGGWEPWAKK